MKLGISFMTVIPRAYNHLIALQVLMVEPVIAADGHTYEKAAIETWLQQHTISPVTGDVLAHTRIVPNVLIKSAIGTNQGL